MDEAGDPPLEYESLICGENDVDTTCTICMAEFLDSDDLYIHMKQVHDSEIQESGKLCDFCSVTYTDKMAYAYHIRDNHIRYFHSCRFCRRIFMKKSELNQHIKKHDYKSGVILCSQCSFKAPKSRAIAEHEYSYHDNNLDGIILSDILPFLSVTLKINAAIFLQSLNVETVYICVGCGFSTPEVKTFIDHAQRDENPVFVCCNCCNTYTNKKHLIRHKCQKTTELLKKQVKTCPECNTVVDKILFRRHKMNCKVIKCHICNIIFSNMDDLSHHQSAEHPLAVELTSCIICKKSFVGQVNLQHHIDRTHKGRLHMYKYLCVYCDNVFKHPQKLFGHLFVHHKDVHPYSCKICDKTFRARKSFTIHIKLEHSSQGFVEFDEKYHVFFTDKKSEKPFVPKSVYKEVDPEPVAQSVNNIELVDGTDNYTETDGNVTEVDAPKPVLIFKKAVKAQKRKADVSESSDDEPLAAKKVNLKKKRRGRRKAKNKFVCDICNKNCYTCQNYTHHMSLHSKTDDKKCIKCFKVFKSKEKLSRHVEKHHSSSKLTETLKNLLEKRKSGINTQSEISQSERFRRTIKKVYCEASDEVITITPIEQRISVQKFIENFTPEDNVKSDLNVKVTVTMVKGLTRDPVIKLTKFKPKPLVCSTKLAMPVKFKDHPVEKSTVKIKVVHEPVKTQEEESPQEYYDDHDYAERAESIPDVAEEVLLDETEEKRGYETRVVKTKVRDKAVELKVAHLVPEAPFFKIVKANPVEPEEVKPEEPETLELPDGTKLVTTNPLAHLLGNTPVEKVLKPMRNKYYKSKRHNLREMLAKALSKLDQPLQKKAKQH